MNFDPDEFYGQNIEELEFRRLSMEANLVDSIRKNAELKQERQTLSQGEVLVHRLKAEIISQTFKDNLTVDVRMPTTWWQHFKQDYAPQWFKERFPTQYKTVTADVTTNHVYPFASDFFKELGNPFVLRRVEGLKVVDNED